MNPEACTLHPDELRDPSSVAIPDPRNESRVVLGSDGFRSRTVDDHHADAASIALHDGVPEGIRTQFETAKNLYLYGWFVYRFFPVAKSHAHACLELALRERFEQEMLAEGEREREFGLGLKKLLKHAVDVGALESQGFDVLRRKAHSRAVQRASIEAIERMKRADIDELDVGPADMRAEDWDAEFVNSLPESMSYVRNHYAHGSSSLDDQVLGVLRLISEIINQIFQRNAGQDDRTESELSQTGAPTGSIDP